MTEIGDELGMSREEQRVRFKAGCLNAPGVKLDDELVFKPGVTEAEAFAELKPLIKAFIQRARSDPKFKAMVEANLKTRAKLN